MLRNMILICIASPRSGGRTLFFLFSWTTIAIHVTACNHDPETPTLISVQGHGTFSSSNNVFTFDRPVWDASSHTLHPYVGSKIEFTVPWPTEIELAIDGKPLTKVEPSLMSKYYKYTGQITNDASSGTANWVVGISTPFDVPYFSTVYSATTYVLTIVDVGNSKRSQPLTIIYKQPTQPAQSTGFTGNYAMGGEPGASPTPPSTSGPCPRNRPEQDFTICFTSRESPPLIPVEVGTKACSYSEAVSLFSNVYPASDWGNTQGPCS